MNLHCLSFFQSQKIKIMSDSCHFHGTFTYKPYLGTVCQNLLEKLSKKSVLVVDLFFWPNFSFIFGNMSDSCRFHGPFMALSWRFLPSDFYCFSKQLYGTCMSDSWQIHRGFMPVSFNPKKSKSCQIHVAFMAVSWHFHIQVLPGYSLPKSIGKSYPKSRCWLSICFFGLISASFLAICQIHVGFMALSWHFLPSDFYYFFQTVSWHLHGRFMAGSWHFPGIFFSFGHVCICHENAMKVP